MDTEKLRMLRWSVAMSTLGLIGGCDTSHVSRGSARSNTPAVKKHRIERKKRLKITKASQRRNRGTKC